MQRFLEIVGRLIEELGRYPLEDGLAPYREIEFPSELTWTGPQQTLDEEEAQRRAS